jgi:hypothetical protein
VHLPVVRYVGAGGEDMYAGEGCRADQAEQTILNLRYKITLGGKPPLPVLHLTAEIGPHVEPIVIFGLIQVVQPVGEAS